MFDVHRDMLEQNERTTSIKQFLDTMLRIFSQSNILKCSNLIYICLIILNLTWHINFNCFFHVQIHLT